jgi:hypothetical protein
MFSDRFFFDCIHLASEASELCGIFVVSLCEQKRGPEDNEANADRDFIVCSFLVLDAGGFGSST